jgi:hypothetical protein
MLPLERVWAVLNPSVTVHSPKPVMGHRLVELKLSNNLIQRRQKYNGTPLFLIKYLPKIYTVLNNNNSTYIIVP